MKTMTGYILKVHAEYPKELQQLHSDLSLLPKTMKMIRARNLCVILKKNYVTYIKALRQALVYGLVQEKAHRLIKFNQENWLKPYKDVNTELRAKAKNDFDKDLSKLIKNLMFRKNMENVTRHRDIKLVTIDGRRSHLVSKPKYGK